MACCVCDRAQPIDILTANLHLAEEFDVSADEPYKVFNGLSLQEVQELHAAVHSMQVSKSQRSDYALSVSDAKLAAGCTYSLDDLV